MNNKNRVVIFVEHTFSEDDVRNVACVCIYFAFTRWCVNKTHTYVEFSEARGNPPQREAHIFTVGWTRGPVPHARATNISGVGSHKQTRRTSYDSHMPPPPPPPPPQSSSSESPSRCLINSSNTRVFLTVQIRGHLQDLDDLFAFRPTNWQQDKGNSSL
jgi:hypothetical protein